jgi:outer membrane protein assembly factor BamB
MRRVLLWLLVGAPWCSLAVAEKPAAPATRPAVASPASLRATSQAGDDWPCFLGPTGDSKSSERGILTKWPDTGPPLVWQLPLGTGYGMPTIKSGRLFQFDRAGANARLRALDSRTGKPLWTFEYASDFEDLYGYDNGPRCSPLVDDDRVYLFGAEGLLHCLNASDGKPIWKVDTAADFGVIQNFFGVGSSPVVEGPLLIVQVGGSPPQSKSVPIGRLD